MSSTTETNSFSFAITDTQPDGEAERFKRLSDIEVTYSATGLTFGAAHGMCQRDYPYPRYLVADSYPPRVIR